VRNTANLGQPLFLLDDIPGVKGQRVQLFGGADVADGDAPAGVAAFEAVGVGVEREDDIDAAARLELSQAGGEAPGFGKLATRFRVQAQAQMLAFAPERLGWRALLGVADDEQRGGIPKAEGSELENLRGGLIIEFLEAQLGVDGDLALQILAGEAL